MPTIKNRIVNDRQTYLKLNILSTELMFGIKYASRLKLVQFVIDNGRAYVATPAKSYVMVATLITLFKLLLLRSQDVNNMRSTVNCQLSTVNSQLSTRDQTQVPRDRSKCWQIIKTKSHLVPTIIKPHGHRADEWLHSRCRLVVWRPESPSNIFVV